MMETKRTNGSLEASTVILAAGDFPRRGGAAWAALAAARRVVCCDSAARAYRRRFGRWPTVTVGDLDSLGPVPAGCAAVRVEDENTNDLEKALAHCRARGWNDIVIVGASGRREDHAIGNVFRALEAEVPVLTDYGVFLPVRGHLEGRAPIGTGVSVFAADPSVRLTSTGLRWPLDGVRFASPYCATLNRTAAETFTVSGVGKAFVYLERTKTARKKKRPA